MEHRRMPCVWSQPVLPRAGLRQEAEETAEAIRLSSAAGVLSPLLLVSANLRSWFLGDTMKPITWQEFRSRYTEEALCFLAESTQFKVAGILDSIERIISPNKLRDL